MLENDTPEEVLPRELWSNKKEQVIPSSGQIRSWILGIEKGMLQNLLGTESFEFRLP
jgi:hypothetical protein